MQKNKLYDPEIEEESLYNKEELNDEFDHQY